VTSIEPNLPVRVGVLHHHPLVALGLRAILTAQDGIQLQASGSLPQLQAWCDVMVCDLETGIAATRDRSNMGMLGASARVLVHTESASDFHVRHALSVGIHGYVVPGTSAAELLQGVRAVAAGQRYLSAAVAHRLAESLSYAALTPRESDVLTGLSGGQCNKLIARHLGISVTTVKAHVNAIMKKMSVESRTQAVSVAAQRGLVRIPSVRAHHSSVPSGAR